jgi:hypothetical protein
MSGFFMINRDDLREALAKVTGANPVNEDALNEFVVAFGNRIDGILEDEARKFTGVEPPIGFA